MSLKTSNKTGANTYELEISIDASKFEEAIQSAYIKARKNISVPGFRKGKAPRKMIEKMYGEGVFFEDAVNQLLPDALESSAKEAELVLVDRPEVEITEISKENGVSMKAKCIVKPEVEVSEYKGIEVKKIVNDVTDEDVDKYINNIRERNSRMVTVEDRAAKNDDDTVIDFEGFIDGEAFEGGKAEKFSLKLGSGQFIPGFEEQIIGHSTGEDFDVNVTFPEDYQMKEIAGKPATFKVKLHEIKMKELPDLDDEFVKDATEFDTLAELKDDAKKKIAENNDKEADNKVENEIFDKVIEKTNGEIPEVMFESRIDEMVQEFANRLSYQGMNLDLYFQFTGMDMAAFRKTFEERAKKEVTLRLALESIAKIENIEVTEDDYNAEIQRMADAYKMDLDKVKSIVSADVVKDDLKVGKAAELVKSAAKISE